MVLSARHESDDKVEALDEGADDYVTKPFDMEELLARVRAAIRRSGGDESPLVVEAGDVRLDVTERKATRGGREVRLTPTEWHIVEVLARREGRLVRQADLLHEVWGPGYDRETNYLRVYMAQLRRKLEQDPSRPTIFLTDPGHRLPTRDRSSFRLIACSTFASTSPSCEASSSTTLPGPDISSLKRGWATASRSESGLEGQAFCVLARCHWSQRATAAMVCWLRIDENTSKACWVPGSSAYVTDASDFSLSALTNARACLTDTTVSLRAVDDEEVRRVLGDVGQRGCLDEVVEVGLGVLAEHPWPEEPVAHVDG